MYYSFKIRLNWAALKVLLVVAYHIRIPKASLQGNRLSLTTALLLRPLPLSPSPLRHAEALFPNLTMGDENLFNIFEKIRLSQLVMQEVRQSSGPREGLPMNPEQASTVRTTHLHKILFLS